MMKNIVGVLQLEADIKIVQLLGMYKLLNLCKYSTGVILCTFRDCHTLDRSHVCSKSAARKQVSMTITDHSNKNSHRAASKNIVISNHRALSSERIVKL